MRGKIPGSAGGITATINRAILVFVFAALPFSDAAARQNLTITNGIYEARLQFAVTGTAGLRVIGRLQNRTTTKLQFRTIAVSYACPDGSRHNSQVSLGHLMPEVESDKVEQLVAAQHRLRMSAEGQQKVVLVAREIHRRAIGRTGFAPPCVEAPLSKAARRPGQPSARPPLRVHGSTAIIRFTMRMVPASGGLPLREHRLH